MATGKASVLKQKKGEWAELGRAKKSSKLRSCEKMSMCGMLDRAQNKQAKIKPQKDGQSPCLKFLQTEDQHVTISKVWEIVRFVIILPKT